MESWKPEGIACEKFSRHVVQGRAFKIESERKYWLIAERLDCGGFSAAVGTRENHPPSKSSRSHENAAQAGVARTLRAFPQVFSI
jgi:hypothetical protein